MAKRVALITGGARGIGRGVALDLAKNGWMVAICYRTSQQDAEEVKQTIESQGSKAMTMQCDVSNPNEATRLVQQVEQTYGRIDALINGAGPYHRVPLFVGCWPVGEDMRNSVEALTAYGPSMAKSVSI